jgi:hypothetical protein
MRTITIDAKNKAEAKRLCQAGEDGFTPDEIYEVDSGDENTRAWTCFESAEDARIWKNQK